MGKRLIVNADDFGYTVGVNRAITECAQHGILTSATLMASGAAFEDAVAKANSDESNNMGVGCHVVLVDGTPISASTKLARGGHFGTSSITLARRAAIGSHVRLEIEAETYAQAQKLRARGVTPTHVDAHKHAHLFPQVLGAVLGGAKRAGVFRVRNPFEPVWSLSISEAFRPAHRKRTVQVAVLRAMRGRFQRIVTEQGCATTCGSIGIVTTGTLDVRLIIHMLDRMPEGTWELVCHPGYNDPDLRGSRTRLTTSRDIEREALTSPEVKRAVERNGIQLISYAEL